MKNSTAKEIICCRCGKETLFYTIAPYGSVDDGDPVCAECFDSTNWRVRAKKAEAELAAARPLIDAASVAEVSRDVWGEMLVKAALAYRVVKAALAYREAKEKP